MRSLCFAMVLGVTACGRSGLDEDLTVEATGAAAAGPGAPVTPPAACRMESQGSFEGVSLRMVSQRCRFTLAEAQQGLTFKAELVAQEDAPFFETQRFFPCQQPEPSGSWVMQRLFGGEQSYAVTDVGRCVSPHGSFGVKKGASPLALTWTGHNWSGPSDTNKPLGPAFPAGSYRYEVHVLADDARSDMAPVDLTATLFFELVP